jgi:hypothetical protein
MLSASAVADSPASHNAVIRMRNSLEATCLSRFVERRVTAVQSRPGAVWFPRPREAYTC